MKSKEILVKSIKYFLTWRVLTFLIAILAVYLIPTWGGWYPYVDRALSITNLPSWIWGWGGFDGVHYLRLAQGGYYYQGSQAFFPIFPILVNLVSRLIPIKNYLDPNFFVNTNYFYAGMLISNVAAFLAIFFGLKLFDLEYGKEEAKKIMIFLLAFPAAFYMGAIYTESIFILFSVLTLYFYKKEKLLPAAIFGFLTSATKVLGVFIPLILVIDALLQIKKGGVAKKSIKTLLAGIVGGGGLLAYMIYLQSKFGDWLMFLHVQSGFGAERTSEKLITLPQVIYRYIKIFITLGPDQMRFYNALFEFLFTGLAFYFLILAFKKIKASYWISTLGILLLPTLTGTFSSMPRYVLTAFILFPFVVLKLKKAYTPVVVALAVLEAICIALFTRGYWVA